MPGLRKARDINAVACRYAVALLYSLAAESDGFGVAAGEVMRDREDHNEDRILGIVRAHPDRLLQMRNGLVRSVSSASAQPR